jgi:inner membrane transporter RhtA
VGQVLAAMCSLQLGAALATTMFAAIGPAGTVTLRVGIGAIVLLAVWRPPLRGHAPAQLRLLVGLGIAMAGMNLCFYSALDRLPLGIVVSIQLFGPLAVGAAGSRHAVDLLWVGLAAAGVVLLSRGAGSDFHAAGVVLAVLAGAFWGAYIVLIARAGQAFADGSGLALSMALAGLALLPLGITAGGHDILRPEILAAGIGVSLLSAVIPYSLELAALRKLPTHVFGVLMSLEPAIAALAGLVVLGQSLRPLEVVAIGLVAIASAGAALKASEAYGAIRES